MTPEEQIAQVASTIIHCGDYGQCFWNEKTKTIHWVGGDSDFPSKTYQDDYNAHYTTHEDAIACFMAIPGVENLVIADEYFPAGFDEDEDEDLDEPGDEETEGRWKEIPYDNTLQRVAELEEMVVRAREDAERWEKNALDPKFSYMPGTKPDSRKRNWERLAELEAELAALKNR
jgi:hypothetical protein